jgi:hypothetical protein
MKIPLRILVLVLLAGCAATTTCTVASVSWPGTGTVNESIKNLGVAQQSGVE